MPRGASSQPIQHVYGLQDVYRAGRGVVHAEALDALQGPSCGGEQYVM